MLMFIYKLVGNLDLQKQTGGIDLVRRTRLFVFACLLQLRAIAGTIQCYLALLSATLWANSPVYCRTKALLFANLTDDAAQSGLSLLHYVIPRRGFTSKRESRGRRIISIKSPLGRSA